MRYDCKRDSIRRELRSGQSLRGGCTRADFLLQKGFSGFKLVTTSMFVIGIGLILFSIFSWIFFNERFFAEHLPTLAFDSDAPTGSQRLPKRYVFSENTSQSYQENILVENEDDFETASDVSVDLILDSLTDVGVRTGE